MYRKYKTNYKKQKKPDTIVDDEDTIEIDVPQSNLKQKQQIIHLSDDEIRFLIEDIWQNVNNLFV